MSTTASGKTEVPRAPPRPRRPLKQIIAQIKPASYERRSGEFAADGRPVGQELW
jgi:hypothetical protein